MRCGNRAEQMEKLKLLLEGHDQDEEGLSMSRESEKQMEKLKLLLEAHRKNEAALAKPAESKKQQADPNTNESHR